jgi:hypothetical protein
MSQGTLSLDTSANTHPTTQRHIPEDSNPQQDRYKNLFMSHSPYSLQHISHTDTEIIAFNLSKRCLYRLYTELQFLPRREHRPPLLQRPIGECCFGKR